MCPWGYLMATYPTLPKCINAKVEVHVFEKKMTKIYYNAGLSY